MNLYVGNLSYDASNEDLEQLFSPFGTIVSAKVISDSHTGRSRGFGFVEYESAEAGEQAIEELNGTDFKGRNLVVNQARPNKGGGSGGGGGGGRGGPRW